MSQVVGGKKPSSPISPSRTSGSSRFSLSNPYSLEEVIRMKDQMITYLRNEKEKLEEEIRTGIKPEERLPVKNATKSSLSVGAPQLVLIGFLALILGYIAGSR